MRPIEDRMTASVSRPRTYPLVSSSQPKLPFRQSMAHRKHRRHSFHADDGLRARGRHPVTSGSPRGSRTEAVRTLQTRVVWVSVTQRDRCPGAACSSPTDSRDVLSLPFLGFACLDGRRRNSCSVSCSVYCTVYHSRCRLIRGLQSCQASQDARIVGTQHRPDQAVPEEAGCTTRVILISRPHPVLCGLVFSQRAAWCSFRHGWGVRMFRATTKTSDSGVKFASKYAVP